MKMSRRRDNILLLFLWFLPLLIGCGDFEHDGYYPEVYSIKVAVGKDYIDVTIRGVITSIHDFISDVEVIKVGREIILIPIVGSPSSGADATGPFEETVRIDGLQRGRYGITIMGRDETTRERIVITKKIEIK